MARSKPKIALNMTTLNRGGVLQRAISFIRNLDGDLAGFDWNLFVSARVAAELKNDGTTVTVPISVFPTSPARNGQARREIAAAINAADSDLVFTFAGPSYLKLKQPELMGVVDGWVTHSDRFAWQNLPTLRHRIGLYLSSMYKKGWIKKADAFVVQTETAGRGLADRVKLQPSTIHVVPNAIAPWYLELQPERFDKNRHDKSSEHLQVFYFAAAYSHKRHDMIPDVAVEMQRQGKSDFEFLVTLPEDDPLTLEMFNKARRLGVSEKINNIGPVPVTRGIELYHSSDICFVPSILETFSATYIESMATLTPMVVADLGFAKEICGTAACYFSPCDPADAAEKILQVATEPTLRKKLVDNGLKQLRAFPDVPQQMKMYTETLTSVLEMVAG